MAVDIPKLFNEQLPAMLSKNSEEAKSINATYQMNITGAGSWFLDLTSTVRKIERRGKARRLHGDHRGGRLPEVAGEPGRRGAAVFRGQAERSRAIRCSG